MRNSGQILGFACNELQTSPCKWPEIFVDGLIVVCKSSRLEGVNLKQLQTWHTYQHSEFPWNYEKPEVPGYPLEVWCNRFKSVLQSWFDQHTDDNFRALSKPGGKTRCFPINPHIPCSLRTQSDIFFFTCPAPFPRGVPARCCDEQSLRFSDPGSRCACTPLVSF